MLKIYKTEELGKLVKLKKSKTISKSWFSLINPTAEEIRQVSALLKVDSDILRNSLDADERSRVELDEGIFSTIVNGRRISNVGLVVFQPVGNRPLVLNNLS